MTASPLVRTPPLARRLSLRERARAREGRAELLLFRMAQEYFATDLSLSEEAIELGAHAIHTVPGRLASRMGVVNLRESLLPLYTPAPVLGVPVPEAPAMAIIFPTWAGHAALAVDEVEDVFTADLASLRDAPGQSRGAGIVLGTLHHEGRLVAMVDAEALVAACRGEASAAGMLTTTSGARPTRAMTLETT